MAYSSIEELVAAASAATQKVLENDIAPLVEDILRNHISSDIYGVYSPRPGAWVRGTTYHRRHVLEGEITSWTDGMNTLFTTSIAVPSRPVVKGYSVHGGRDGGFLKLLGEGNMGIWRRGFPRPAVMNAQREVNSSKQIYDAAINGIKRELGL